MGHPWVFYGFLNGGGPGTMVQLKQMLLIIKDHQSIKGIVANQQQQTTTTTNNRQQPTTNDNNK